MKVKKLQFENFRNFPHHEIQFPDHPIIIIYDENGRGKTTIQEGILWSLSGEVFRYNRDDLKSEYGTIDSLYNLRADKKSRIQLIMEMEDEDGEKIVTKINRPRRRKTYLTPSLDLDLQYHINQEKVSKEEFFDFIENLTKLHPRRFQTTNFLSQEIINEALVIDDNIRANVFSQILSFDWMQDINSSISDEIKELRKIKKSLKYEKNKLNEELGETEINQLWNDLNNQIDKFQDQGLKLENDDKISSFDYLNRIKKAFELINQSTKIKEVKKYLDGDKDLKNIDYGELKDYHDHIDNEIKNLQEQIGELKSQIKLSSKENETIISSVKDYKIKYGEHKQLDEKIKSKIKDRKKIESSLNKLETQNETYEQTLEKYSKQSKNVNNLKDKIEAIDQEYGNIEKITERIDEISNKVDQLKSNEKVLQENEKKIVKENDSINKLEKNIEGLTNEISDLSNKSLNTLLTNLDNIIEKFNDNMEFIEEKHKESINPQLDEIQNLINEDKPNIDLEQLTKELDLLLDQIGKIPKESIIDELQNYKSIVRTHKDKIKEKPQLKEIRESYNNEKDTKSKELEQLEGKIDQLDQKISDAQTYSNYSKTSRIGILIFSIILTVFGITTSGVVQYVSIGIGIIGFLGFLALLLPGIWFNYELIETPMLHFISKDKYESILEKEKNKLSEQYHAKQKQIRNIAEKLLDINEKINEIDELTSKIDQLKISEIEILDKRLDAYKQLPVISEKIENQKEYLNDVKLKLSKEKEKSEIIKKLETQKQDLRNALEKNQDDIDFNIDYNKPLDEITGEIKSQKLELEEKIKGLSDEKELLLEKKDEVLEYKKEIGNIDQELKENNDIEINDLEDKIESLTISLDEFEEKIQNKKETIEKLQDEISDLQDQKSQINTKLKSITQFLKKNFEALDIEEDVLEKDQEDIISLINTKFENIDQNYSEKENITTELENISAELDLLDDYFTNLKLLQKRWNEKQEEISQIEEKIRVLETKIANIEDLENAWQVVSDSMQDSTENISEDILQVIKNDVVNYFDLLGGHDTLSHVDLEIRVLRNKLSVSINVGTDKENAGSPKVLLSNGEQVSLILAIFFAMSRQIMKKSKIKWIGVDEPTQYLDTTRKADFVDFIHLFYEDNPDLQLVITTADKEFVEMLENKNEDVFHITSIKDISSSEFSDLDYKSTSELVETRKKQTKSTSSTEDEVELPELKSDFSIPSKSKERKSVGTIDVIDEVPEGKEYTCSICRSKFSALAHQEVCNKNECIREYKNTMFNL